MRRVLICAATCITMTGGLLAAPPAGAATAPTIESVTASRSSVISISAQSSKTATVKVTAVFNDPDRLLSYLDVYDDLSGRMTKSYARADEVPGSGSRRTFVVTYQVYPAVAAGKRTVKLVGRGASVAGDPAAPTGVASFVVRHKPKLTLNRTPLWGPKARFYGSLYDTSRPAKCKVQLQFKAKGSKGWTTRQKLRTNADGRFESKTFNVTKPGTWRVTSKKVGKYILKAKPDTVKVKRG